MNIIEVFFTKTIPALPLKAKEALVKYGPVAYLLLGGLTVVVLNLQNLDEIAKTFCNANSTISDCVNTQKDFYKIINIYTSIGVMLITLFVAYKLSKKSKVIWRLLLALSLVGIVFNTLDIAMLRGGITSSISSIAINLVTVYLLYQTKAYYH